MNNLKSYATALGAFAIIVLMVLTINAQFTKSMRSSTHANVTGISVTANDTSIALGTSYPFVQGISGCKNTSNGLVIGVGNYTYTEGGASGGAIVISKYGDEIIGCNMHCRVAYLANTDTQAVGDNFATGIGYFGTFAPILAIAIVGVIVIAMFTRKKKGGGL
jgi:hypothetical protein